MARRTVGIGERQKLGAEVDKISTALGQQHHAADTRVAGDRPNSRTPFVDVRDAGAVERGDGG
jgi:hypothetical protein